MNNNLISLSDDHKDLLAEIFNMGMGQSLGALSQITSKEHEISFELPKVRIISYEDFLESINSEDAGKIVQDYSGIIHGKAIFYFSAKTGKELAKLLIGTDIPVDYVEKIESDALVEIGNIFINSSLSCLANFLGIEIYTKVPKLMFGNDGFSRMQDNRDVIYLSAGFNIEHLNLQGVVVLILNDESTQKLIEIIDQGNA